MPKLPPNFILGVWIDQQKDVQKLLVAGASNVRYLVIAYSTLDSLPKGVAVNFVVQATLEFLKNHSGETITISGKRQFIVLGNYFCNNPSDNEALQPKENIPDQPDETYTEALFSVTNEQFIQAFIADP